MTSSQNQCHEQFARIGVKNTPGSERDKLMKELVPLREALQVTETTLNKAQAKCAAQTERCNEIQRKLRLCCDNCGALYPTNSALREHRHDGTTVCSNSMVPPQLFRSHR